MAGKRAWTTDLITSNLSSPAEYVRLFDEITSALTVACGVVQTTDTGQLDSASPPALSTTAGGGGNLFGYRVFRFNDTLQATMPIFFRIDMLYTNQASAVNSRLPYFALQVGTGSDGAGNLVGAGTKYNRPTAWSSLAFTATTMMPLGGYPSYACGGNGFMWLAFKLSSIVTMDASGQPYAPKAAGTKKDMFSFALMRSTDADGNPTAEGFIAHFGQACYHASTTSVYWTTGGNSNFAEVRGTSGITTIRDHVSAPLIENYQVSGGQAVISRMPTPFAGLPASPFMGVTGLSAADGDTFSAALVGATPRTYIYPGVSLAAQSPFAVNNTRPYTAPFFLWEGADV